MADDIDIEEHDILENPRIKHILPHVNIKAEPEDYDDPSDLPSNYEDYESYEMEQYESDFEDNSFQDFDMSDYPRPESAGTDSSNEIYHHNNKIILGTKPCPKPQTPIILGSKPSTTHLVCTQAAFVKPCPKSRKPAVSNSENPILKSLLIRDGPIILGTKSYPKPERVLEDAVVVLEDWGDRLSNSPCYCVECETLFATRNALDAHNMIAHSFLVAIDTESPGKDATVRETSEESSVAEISKNSKYCNQCQTYFTDDNLLIQHLYEHLTNARSETPKQFYKCPICFSYYVNLKRFNKHTFLNHSLRCDEIEMVPFNPQCGVCSKTTTLVSHNKHIQATHREYEKKVKKVDDVQAKAKVFKRPASSPKVVLKDTSDSQATPSKLIIDKPSTSQEKRVSSRMRVARYKCTKCLKFYSHRQGIVRHIRNKHPKQNTLLELKSSCNNSYKSVLPENVVFKCKNCNLSLLCATAIKMHLSFKCIKLPSWVCKICNNSFRYKLRSLHEQQHQRSSSIKIYTFSKDIYSRILFKCSQCNVHFEERHFLKHKSLGCVKTAEYRCSVCKIRVHSKGAHGTLHSVHKLTKSDFIFINNVFSPIRKGAKESAKTVAKLPLKKELPDSPETVNLNSAVVLKSGSFKRKLPYSPTASNILFYCEVCNTFGNYLKHRKFHLSKKCLSHRKSTTYCPFCGLLFRRPLNKHKSHHIKHKYTLKDFVFVNVQSGKRFTPTPTEFPKCEHCSVRYITNHNCKDPRQKCAECHNSYDRIAYKLHAIHHKYLLADEDVSKLIERYESLKSTWNIIYVCQFCDLATDSYDRAVEHSQRHLVSPSHLETFQKCDVCAINFDDSSIKKHSALHANREINKSSFEILKYNFADLLNDSWYKLFGKLSDADIKQITSSSKYSMSGTRAVKMNLILDGPSEYTMYKCDNCRCYVGCTSVFVHTHTCEGKASSSSCDVCGIPFSTLEELEKHKKIHKNSEINANSYRIVSFNAKADKDFNLKLEKAKPGHLAKSKGEGVSKLKGKKCIFYQCEVCKSSSLNDLFDIKHNCISKADMWACKSCPYVTTSKYRQHHTQWHASNPSITNQDITIQTFRQDRVESDLKISKSDRKPPAPKTKTYFQCDKCDMLVILSLKHACDKKYAKVCSICNCKFSPRSLLYHMVDHRKDDSLTRDKLKIVASQEWKSHEYKKGKDAVELASNERKLTVFKCYCGLHFTSEKTLSTHSEECSPELRVSSEKCSKCDLLFPTDLLVSHLCSAHSSEANISVEIVTSAYKCAVSNCLFLNKRDFNSHHVSQMCDPNEGVPCLKCGFVFHHQAIDCHNAMHESTNLDKIPHKVVTLAKPGLSLYTLYKCVKCSVHLLEKKAYMLHAANCKGKTLIANCKYCNLKVPLRSIHTHIEKHHRALGLRAGDFRILNGDDEVNNDIDDNDDVNNVTDDMNNVNDDVNIENDVDNEGGISELETSATADKSFTYNNIEYDNKLYKCWCGLYFLTQGTLADHSCSVIDHSLIPRETCGQCGYVFTPVSLCKHEKVHHYEMKLKTSDFVVKDEEARFRLVHKQAPRRKLVRCNTVYQCSKCELSFVKLLATKRHYLSKCAHKFHAVKCNICGLKFYENNMAYHRSIQHGRRKCTSKDFHIFVIVDNTDTENNTTNLDTTIKFDPKVIRKYVNNRKLGRKVALYKCAVCNMHYLERPLLKLHMAGKHDEESTECGSCSLKFTLDTLPQHEQLHHKQRSLNAEDFDIYTDNAKTRRFDETMDSSISSQIESETHSVCETSETKMDLSKSRLYRCDLCDVHFFSMTAVYGHFSANHRLGVVLACDQCGLRFSQASMEMHELMHHVQKQLSVEDFVIHNVKSLDEYKDNIIYKCGFCDHNFLCLSSLDTHIKRDRHFKCNSNYCPHCNLVFTYKSLMKHINLHHTRRFLQLNDFIIKIYDGVSLDISLNTSEVKEIGEVSSISSMSVEDTSQLSDSVNDKSDLVKKIPDEQPVSQSDPDDSIAKIEPQNSELTKLYKCGECKVFFLNQYSCYKHVVNHTPMDPKEYIECKLCSLQFRIMSLPRHIQKHHATEFELSKVLVEEYQPKLKSQKTPKIDIYYAIDKVQSRLVSTTTSDDKDSEKLAVVSQSNIDEVIDKSNENYVMKDRKYDITTKKDDNICPTDRKDTTDDMSGTRLENQSYIKTINKLSNKDTNRDIISLKDNDIPVEIDVNLAEKDENNEFKKDVLCKTTSEKDDDSSNQAAKESIELADNVPDISGTKKSIILHKDKTDVVLVDIPNSDGIVQEKALDSLRNDDISVSKEKNVIDEIVIEMSVEKTASASKLSGPNE